MESGQESERLYIGIDLGGTNIKVGLVAPSGQVRAIVSVVTGRGPEAVISNMVAAVHGVLKKAQKTLADVTAVGIASPGPFSRKQGVVMCGANLPGWENIPLRDRISIELGKPAILENDARSAAFGEYWGGSGRQAGVRDFLMITLGTGVGGGFVYDGRIVNGAHDLAGEIGHTIVVPDGEPCGCGQKGCLEVYTAASRLGRRARLMIREHGRRNSTLRTVLEREGMITARDIEQEARSGDTLALEIWDDMCRMLALACVNATHWLDPKMIVLAGGLSGAGDFLVEPVKRYFSEQYWHMSAPEVEIRIAELGNAAGVVGAAMLAMQSNLETDPK